MDISKIKADNRVAEAQVKELQQGNKSSASVSINQDSQKTSESKTQSGLGAEKLNWSADMALHKEGLELAKGAADVRAEKVAALKEAIRGGQYRSDPSAIADAMLSHAMSEHKL